MSKPVVLFDIDGCLNIIMGVLPGHPAPNRPFLITEVQVPKTVGVFRTHVAFETIRQVNQLLPDITPFWFTSWFQDAPAFGKAIRLPEFPVLGSFEDLEGIPGDEEGNPEQWWKLQVLEKLFLTEPLVWVDDEFQTFPNDVQNWLKTRTAPTCLVPCNPREGLDAQELEEALITVSQ